MLQEKKVHTFGWNSENQFIQLNQSMQKMINPILHAFLQLEKIRLEEIHVCDLLLFYLIGILIFSLLSN